MKAQSVPISVKLAFDPEYQGRRDSVIKEIFENKTARILYLAIKVNHIVNQYFNDNCLKIAKWIDDGDLYEDTNYSPSRMGVVLNYWLRNLGMIGSSETYGSKLIPFILGEKIISFSY